MDITFNFENFKVMVKICYNFPSQRRGYGGLLLNAIEQELRLRILRPVRVESAFRAVEFFKAQSYRPIGEPVECVFSGSALFRTLQTMEKFSRT